jgi:tRNA A58 N-methylase Trm61
MLNQKKGVILDIGAGDGLFSVYLADSASEVIAVESEDTYTLRRNFSSNNVTNFRIYSELEDIVASSLHALDNVAIVRVNSPVPLDVIKFFMGMIQKCMPIILLHMPASGQEVVEFKDLLTSFGYSVEHLFELLPQTVLCTNSGHRDASSWLLI